MLDVATGSNDLNAEIFCYKYPDERSCKGIGFLPMLFMFPQVNDYANTSVILGLGDIVCKSNLNDNAIISRKRIGVCAKD